MEFPSNTLRFISQHFLVDEKILSKTINLEAVATPPITQQPLLTQKAHVFACSPQALLTLWKRGL